MSIIKWVCVDGGHPPFLPCPFCGSSDVAMHQVPQGHDDAGGYFISCAKCPATTDLRFSCGEDARPLLAEQWNTRAAAEVAGYEPIRRATEWLLVHDATARRRLALPCASHAGAFPTEPGMTTDTLLTEAADAFMKMSRNEVGFNTKNSLYWAALARRLREREADAVERAMQEGIAIGAAEVARFIDAPSVGNWIAADDYMRNVKALDVALNGEGGAERPLLIDVLGQVEAERRRLGRPVLEVARLAGQAVAWEHTTPATSDDWTPCPRDFFEKIKDSPRYKVRALGVIATPK